MRRLRRLLAVTLAIGAALVGHAPPAAEATSDRPDLAAAQHATATTPGWTVGLDQSQLRSTLGSRFTFVSTLRNESGQAQRGTIAYVNVLSTQPSVYVDPEDWSSSRTRFLGDVKVGETQQVTWNLQAVNSGSFVVFVVVTSAAGGNDVVSSPALRVTIADRRRLNPTGILPVTLAVPGILALGMGWAWRRRRGLR